jgi:hypothetical protein
MENYPHRRWHVWEYVTNAVTPYWAQVFLEHLTEWEAENWVKAHGKPNTTYAIQGVRWTPEPFSYKEVRYK